MPQVEALVIDPGNEVVVLGTLTQAEVATLEQELQADLAHTDADKRWLLGVALVAVSAGAVIVAIARRRHRSAQ